MRYAAYYSLRLCPNVEKSVTIKSNQTIEKSKLKIYDTQRKSNEDIL